MLLHMSKASSSQETLSYLITAHLESMSDLQRIHHYLLHFAHLVDKSQSLSLLINRLESHKIYSSTDTWTLALGAFGRMGQKSSYILIILFIDNETQNLSKNIICYILVHLFSFLTVSMLVITIVWKV